MMGIDPVIIEKSDRLGGLQNFSPYQNQWIAGVMDTSGRDFAHSIQKHIQQKEIDVIFQANVSSVQQNAGGFTFIYAKSPALQGGDVERRRQRRQISIEEKIAVEYIA